MRRTFHTGEGDCMNRWKPMQVGVFRIGLALLLGVMLLLPAATLAATSTRTSSFEYDATTGLLTAEVVEPDAGEFCVRTVYSYADTGAGNQNLGNRTSATVSNCGTSVPSAAQFTTRTTARSQHAAYSTSINGVSYSVPAGTFPTQATNALNQSETVRHDPRFGGVLSHTDANALTTTRSYDAFGRLVLEVRPDGNRTLTRHCFLQPSISNSAGCTEPVPTPAFAVRYVETEPQNPSGTKNGALSRVYYDALGREIRQETESFDGGGQNTGFIAKDTRYNAHGAVIWVSQPYFLSNGSSDTAGGTSRGLTETEYDAMGRPVRVTVHDPEGNASSPTQVRSSVVTYSYAGPEVTETHTRTWRNSADAVVSTSTQTKITLKDPMGRVLRITDADGAQIAYQYDAQGNLIKTRDPLGNETSAEFDQKGRRTALTDPNTGRYTYTYDALGQLKAQQTPNQRAAGQSTTMAYDLLGRMTARVHAEFTTSWTYDSCHKGVGKLCQVATSHGVTRTLSYDNLGRPNTQTQVLSSGTTLTLNTSTSYNADGRVSSQTWPSGEGVTYAYTNRGYLGEVRRTSGNTLVWAGLRVNARGQVERYSLGNGVITQQVFDAKTGRQDAVRAGLSSAPTAVLNHSYGYDTVGNITDRLDHNGAGSGQAVTENFHYDALNRLTQYDVAGAAIPGQVRRVALQYNALGNLLYKSDVGAYAYPAGGQARPHAAHTVNGTTYTYDANGNLTGASGGKYQTVGYTSFNLPDHSTGVLGRDGTRYRWTYGTDHERVQETRTSTSGTRTTVYLHPDKANGLSYERETADTGVITHRHYFSAMGQAVAVLTTTQSGTNAQTNPRWSYWHRDHLGSVAAVTDANGAVQERYAYDPFGKRRFTDGRLDANGTLVADHPDGAELAAGTKLHDTDRGFTGHEHLDDVGIVNMNGRIYDPLLARFMQPDPQLQELYNLQNFNRYSYVLNNPLKYTDPDGEWFLPIWLAMVASTVASQAITSPELRAVVAVAAMAVLGPGSNFALVAGQGTGTVLANAAIAGFSSGMIASGGDPNAAFRGALTAMMFAGVGQATAAAGSSTQVAAHAAAGCASSVAQGGKCGHGAVSQSISKAFTISTENWDMNIVEGTAANALVGGVSSKIVGGDFDKAAVTAAFGYLFNHCTMPGKCLRQHMQACALEGCGGAGVGGPATSGRSPFSSQQGQGGGSSSGRAVDQATNQPIGRIVVDSKGNAMIEPVGGRTVPAGKGGVDTHTLYPNGSNYQRLNPQGHANNPMPHGHGHLQGTGPGIRGQGPSIDPRGNVVPRNSPDAHWPIR
jgi:RHS repeat-associated protein